jgi:nitric oxide reductase NorQ protein
VRSGAIFYLDEVVEARKDITVVLHPLADDRRQLPLERTGELLNRRPGFMLVLSYNPGYQHVLKGLKPSTRQRFVALTRWATRCPRWKQRIVAAESGCSDDGGAQQLVQAGPAPAPPDRPRPGRDRQHPPAGDGRAPARCWACPGPPPAATPC